MEKGINEKLGLPVQYIAGVADSDGSFSLLKRKKQSTVHGYHYRKVFQLTWINDKKSFNVMNKLKKEYGGNVNVCRRGGYPSEHRDVLKYSVEGEGLKKLVKDIEPHLMLKREQANLINEMFDIRKSWKGRNKPQKLWDKEDNIYLQFNKLNSKNKKI